MKRPIVIAMHDSNFFFLHGLKHIFIMHFHSKKIPVIFSSSAASEGADLMVNSYSELMACKPTCLKVTLRCEDYFGEYSYLQETLSYQTKPDDVFQRLDNLFNTTINGSTEKSIFNDHVGIRISRREKEILQEIVTELSVAQIAKKLHISVKTVSTHKKSAMRKLGFRTSLELYIWLLRMKNI